MFQKKWFQKLDKYIGPISTASGWVVLIITIETFNDSTFKEFTNNSISYKLFNINTILKANNV